MDRQPMLAPIVLIVEDSPTQQEWLIELVRCAFPEAVIIRAGTLAEAIVAGGGPDVCILDLDLPDATGAQGVRALRDHRPDLPVLAISVQYNLPIATEVTALGAVDFLSKQLLDASILAKSIRGALSKRDFEKLTNDIRNRLAKLEKLITE